MDENYSTNCAYCDYFRFENRRIERLNRSEFCIARSSFWPDAKVCPYYRMRTCFLKINGVEPEHHSGGRMTDDEGYE